MWYVYGMEYYSAIKNKDKMNFVGKWMELENIILWENIILREGPSKEA